MEKFERVLLRVSEAAEMIGVSRSKLYEMVAEGVLPYHILRSSSVVSISQSPKDRIPMVI